MKDHVYVINNKDRTTTEAIGQIGPEPGESLTDMIGRLAARHQLQRRLHVDGTAEWIMDGEPVQIALHLNPDAGVPGIPEIEPTENYLYVRHNRSGCEWFVEVGTYRELDLRQALEAWVAERFPRYLIRPVGPVDGDYYTAIITDGRPSDTDVTFADGSFNLEQQNE